VDIRWSMKKGWLRLKMITLVRSKFKKRTMIEKFNSLRTSLTQSRRTSRPLNVELIEKRMRLQAFKRSLRKPGLRKSLERKSWKRRLKKSPNLSKKRKISRTNWKRKKKNFTSTNSKSKISKEPSKCSPIELKRWKHPWSLKNSKLRTLKSNY
jgi:hypothetical protein